MKIACIFPGQGSQYVGMGQALADAYPVADATFAEAEAILGRPLCTICYEGPEAELLKTENTQVAIFAVSVAVWRVLEQHQISPAVMTGHSLGEYSALVASGALSFAEALPLVQTRALLMAEAAAAQPGSMAAVLGLDLADVETICQEVSGSGMVQIANVNCPGQVVISGTKESVSLVIAHCSDAGARRCIPLRVSGAFHSRLMQPAAKALQEVLEKVAFQPPRVPVIANVTADHVTDTSTFPDLLKQQVTSTVQWEATLQRIWNDGIQAFAEIGPGNVLSGLVRRTYRKATSYSIETPEQIEGFLKESSMSTC